MKHKFLLTVLSLVILFIAWSVAFAGSAVAQPVAQDGCGEPLNYIWSTKAGDLDRLVAEVNAMRGTRFQENNRYLVNEILSIDVVDLGGGSVRLVVLFEFIDLCTRGG